MTSKQYTFDAKLIYNHEQITSKRYASKVKRYVLDTNVIEMTKEEILLAIAKGEIAVEIKKKLSNNTMSGDIIKKNKLQETFVNNVQYILDTNEKKLV
jgi:nucleoside diphosphate kinase